MISNHMIGSYMIDCRRSIEVSPRACHQRAVGLEQSGRQQIGALAMEHTSRIGEAICEGE
jgi:hypothetical protein